MHWRQSCNTKITVPQSDVSFNAHPKAYPWHFRMSSPFWLQVLLKFTTSTGFWLWTIYDDQDFPLCIKGPQLPLDSSAATTVQSSFSHSILSTATMIKISHCTIALLLASIAFAAPANNPLADASASIASALRSSTTAKHSSTTSSTATGITQTSSAADATATVPFIDLDPNFPLWDSSMPGAPAGGVVQPVRGSLGATILGPTDDAIAKENPDLLAPPSSDHGSV